MRPLPGHGRPAVAGVRDRMPSRIVGCTPFCVREGSDRGLSTLEGSQGDQRANRVYAPLPPMAETVNGWPERAFSRNAWTRAPVPRNGQPSFSARRSRLPSYCNARRYSHSLPVVNMSLSAERVAVTHRVASTSCSELVSPCAPLPLTVPTTPYTFCRVSCGVIGDRKMTHNMTRARLRRIDRVPMSLIACWGRR